MENIDFSYVISSMKNIEVDRPNKSTEGTLSGHAAGEPFEKCVYHILKRKYPKCIFKQYEYLNDIFLKHPKYITVYGVQNEAYMSRSAEKWVRGLCFNELGVSG